MKYQLPAITLNFLEIVHLIFFQKIYTRMYSVKMNNKAHKVQ